MKYLYDSCKKDPVNINENIIRPGMVVNNTTGENDNDVPPKYEELPPQY